MVKHRSTYTILLGNMSVEGASVTYFFLPIDVIFAPLNEIVCSGAASTVNHLVRIHSHNKLGVFEKMRNIIGPHVAHVLQYALFYINTRLLTFNNNQRNTVNHQHNVGTSILAVGAFYAKFFCNLPNVICGMLKVDIRKVKGLTNGNVLIENNVFLKADTKCQKIIDFLARHRKSLKQRSVQSVDGTLNRVPGEQELITLVFVRLLAQKANELIGENNL